MDTLDDLRFRVLGPLTAIRDGRRVGLGSPQQQLALALLLADFGTQVSTDRLIDGIWSDSPPATARKTLQVYISRLRATLGDGTIETGLSGYRLVQGRLDAREFEDLVVKARSEAEGDPRKAAETFVEALAMWTGSPYSGFEYQDAFKAEIIRLEELRLSALEDRISADLESGLGASLVGELESLTREHPFRERLYGQLMLALYQTGRQADALRVFARVRDHLAKELGVEPGPELRDLEERILQQDPKLTPTPHAVPTPIRAIRGYELREEVALGPHSSVYRAYDHARATNVALKLVPPEVSSRRSYIARFESTASALERIEHAHIVPLIDFWRDAEGAYLVWEWMDGGSLRDSLADGRPWAPGSALNLVGQIGSALSHVHRSGIVHGNLKPGNVLLDGDGVAYVADFALGPQRSEGPYVAPELGKLEQPTVRSDVHSLGVICHQLLTGSLPGGDQLSGLINPEVQRVVNRAIAVDPGDRFERVEDFLRAVRQATGLDVVPIDDPDRSSEYAVRNPYKGLRAFQELDADDFYGRDEMISTIVETATKRSLVTVVGPSGSGKSSLVKAGLVPALKGDIRDRPLLITEMYPGTHPFEELDTALRRIATDWPDQGAIGELTADAGGLQRMIKQILPEDTELVLVIDQFEELFSLLNDEATRALFIEALTQVASEETTSVLVVITLRADFFDRPLQYSEFGRLLKRGLVPLTTPSRMELAEAVSRPARRVGLDYEDGLISEIVSEVADQPGALPLMQFALTEMVERADSPELTFESFRRQGGIGGAIGAKAEDLYVQEDETGRQAIQQMFLRLAHVDGEGTYTRRRVLVKELTDLRIHQGPISGVLNAFAAHRLLTFDRDPITRGPTIEVAHEALLRQWPRLRQWLGERRQDLVHRQRLREARQEWLANDADDAFLLTGGRLAQYVAWAETTDLRLSPDDLSFLEMSQTSSQEQRAIAEKKEIERIARSALATVDDNPERSLLVAVAAAERSRNLDGTLVDDVAETLHEALIRLRIVATIEAGGAIGLATDGHELAVAGRNGSLTFHDLRDLEVLRELPRSDRPLDVMAYLPTGESLVGVDSGGVLHWWDVAHGGHFADVDLGVGGAGRPWWVDVSGDERFVAVGVDRSGEVSIFAAATGDLIRSLAVDSPTDGRFSPDSSRLVISDTGGNLVYFDTSNWLETPAESPALGTRINRMKWSPDGGRLVFTTETAGTVTWDVRRGRPVHIVPGLFAGAVDVSPTGRHLVVGGTDGKSRCIDIATGAEVATLAAHALEVREAYFTQSGDRVVTTGVDGTRLWDVTPVGQREMLTLQAHPTTGNAANSYFSNDGTLLVTTSKEREAKVWETGRWKTTITINGLPTLPGQSAFTLDGGRVAVALGESPEGITSFRDTRLTHAATHTGIFDTKSGELVVELAGHEGHEIGRAFRPDGRRVVTAGLDSIISLWDAETGRLLDSERSEHGRMNLVSFDHEGHLVVVGNEDGTFTIWELSADRLKQTLTVPAHHGAVFARFSPDGERIATASEDSTGGIWDVAGNLITRLIGHTAVAWNVAWAPDGDTVATVSIDGSIRIWNPETGDLRMTLTAPDYPVASSEISPDGIMAVPAGQKGRVYLYTLKDDELVRLARERLTRELTPQERVAFGVDPPPTT